jgi:hypothetical protein
MASGAPDKMAKRGGDIYSPVDGESDYCDAECGFRRRMDKCAKWLDSTYRHSAEHHTD